MDERGPGDRRSDPARVCTAHAPAHAVEPRDGSASRHDGRAEAAAAAPISMARPMRRSISAPTIAVCWWPARPMTVPRRRCLLAHHPAGRGDLHLGRLSEAAIERAVEALSVCRDKMRNRGVTRARLIATEACRRPPTAPTFSTACASEVGIELEIVDRETEALLAATGCTPLIDPRRQRRHPVRHRRRLVRARPARPLGAGPARPAACRQIRAWVSLPVGVVTLAERHGGIAGRRAPFSRPWSPRSRSLVARFARRAWAQRSRRPHAHAGHVRHGDDDLRACIWACSAMTAARSTAAGCRTTRSPRWSSGCWR